MPILSDCDNYYSGTSGDKYWHQNSDQVYVYIPLTSEITKKDIDVAFNVLQVDVRVGEESFSFETKERLIPDGSFWVFESDSDGNVFLLLDIEKRYRMINWKCLFDTLPIHMEEESEESLEGRRSDMLEKLFAANKNNMAGPTGGDGDDPAGFPWNLEDSAGFSLDDVRNDPEFMRLVEETGEKIMEENGFGEGEKDANGPEDSVDVDFDEA